MKLGLHVYFCVSLSLFFSLKKKDFFLKKREGREGKRCERATFLQEKDLYYLHTGEAGQSNVQMLCS